MGRRTQANSLKRQKYVRDPYDKVLIVCEGEKTEPNYFKGLRNHLRLKTANVAIVGEGATPAKIVERAKELEKREKERGDPYDKVFCVLTRIDIPIIKKPWPVEITKELRRHHLGPRF